VYLVAWLRPSVISPCYENQAQVGCRQMGSKWQCKMTVDFEWTEAEAIRNRVM
jgi:hypothetical protein